MIVKTEFVTFGSEIYLRTDYATEEGHKLWAEYCLIGIVITTLPGHIHLPAARGLVLAWIF